MPERRLRRRETLVESEKHDDDSCSWSGADEQGTDATRREMWQRRRRRRQEVGIGIPLFNRGSLGEY